MTTFLLPSCLEKQEDCPITYTIEGHLFGDCSKNPIEGLTLYLYVDLQRGILKDTVVTDSTGYFKLQYNSSSGVFLYILYRTVFGDFVSIIENIPINTTFWDFDLYRDPTANLNVYLDVKNPYTEFDTLGINNFTSEGFRLPGPFNSGYILKIESAPLFDMRMKENNHYLASFLLPYKGATNFTYYTVSEYCSDDVPVTIVLE